MRKYVSYIASEIDNEYRRKKAYAKKQRAKCQEKQCYNCEYARICSVSNDGINKEQI